MGADCKSVAKATVVRTHYLPPESARFRRGLALSLFRGLFTDFTHDRTFVAKVFNLYFSRKSLVESKP